MSQTQAAPARPALRLELLDIEAGWLARVWILPKEGSDSFAKGPSGIAREACGRTLGLMEPASPWDGKFEEGQPWEREIKSLRIKLRPCRNPDAETSRQADWRQALGDLIDSGKGISEGCKLMVQICQKPGSIFPRFEAGEDKKAALELLAMEESQGLEFCLADICQSGKSLAL